MGYTTHIKRKIKGIGPPHAIAINTEGKQTASIAREGSRRVIREVGSAGGW